MTTLCRSQSTSRSAWCLGRRISSGLPRARKASARKRIPMCAKRLRQCAHIHFWCDHVTQTQHFPDRTVPGLYGVHESTGAERDSTRCRSCPRRRQSNRAHDRYRADHWRATGGRHQGIPGSAIRSTARRRPAMAPPCASGKLGGDAGRHSVRLGLPANFGRCHVHGYRNAADE